jgi:hypothetical protein
MRDGTESYVYQHAADTNNTTFQHSIHAAASEIHKYSSHGRVFAGFCGIFSRMYLNVI